MKYGMEGYLLKNNSKTLEENAIVEEMKTILRNLTLEEMKESFWDMLQITRLTSVSTRLNKNSRKYKCEGI